MSFPDIEAELTRGLDTAAHVVERRPGRLWQLDLPAFLDDGDGVQVYVQLHEGHFVLTDLGSIRMRASYIDDLTPAADRILIELAERQGFSSHKGEFRTDLTPGRLVPAALGLIQLQSQAEVALRQSAKHTRRAVRFRHDVIELLSEAFGASHIQRGFHDSSADPEGLFAIDAYIEAKRPLAIACISSSATAERAIATKLKTSNVVAQGTRWVGVPRDIAVLDKTSHKRLVREYMLVGGEFDTDRKIVETTLRDLAAA